MNARKALVCELLGAASALRIVETREPQTHRANMSRVTDWAAEDKLATHIHAIHELVDFQAAFAEIGKRRAQGKVLLRLH